MKSYEDQEKETTTRREVAKTALYAIPAILSMSATPAFASRGSGWRQGGGGGGSGDDGGGRGGLGGK